MELTTESAGCFFVKCVIFLNFEATLKVVGEWCGVFLLVDRWAFFFFIWVFCASFCFFPVNCLKES